MKSKNGLIVTGGIVSIKQLNDVYKQGGYDLVIGVDHGLDYLLGAEIDPDIILGDFDSVSKESLEYCESHGVKRMTFPSNKNLTDTHLAILEAIKLGLERITLIGATGSRLDHSLSNIFVVAGFAGQIDITLIDENNLVRVAEKECEIKKEDYPYISLVPVTKQVTKVCFKGVKYPLEDATLSIGASLGISNEITSREATLSYDEGLMLLIKSRD